MCKLLFRLWIVVILLVTAPLAGAVRLYLTEVAPFAFMLEGNGRYDGINIRIANELQKRTGIPLEVIVVPSPRHVVLFPADTEAYSISHRENFTDDDGLILADVTQYPVVVVAKSGVVMTNFDDVIAQSQDKGIGMLRRMTYGTFGQDERVKKVDISTLENGLRMLEIGRISGVVGSLPAILAAAEKNGSTHLIGSRLVITHGTHVLRVRPDFALSRTSKALTTALAAMRNDGTIARIMSDFLNDPKTGAPRSK
ncbi:hypothetical protein ACO0LB_04150 [Undibacterium sp. SXout7W]|uniref:hypothetical protein n=1 Tax=Undibacterium sp. SXout7W TaxID=3413049 RepID=UPI003BF1626F